MILIMVDSPTQENAVAIANRVYRELNDTGIKVRVMDTLACGAGKRALRNNKEFPDAVACVISGRLTSIIKSHDNPRVEITILLNGPITQAAVYNKGGLPVDASYAVRRLIEDIEASGMRAVIVPVEGTNVSPELQREFRLANAVFSEAALRTTVLASVDTVDVHKHKSTVNALARANIVRLALEPLLESNPAKYTVVTTDV